ncbi:MAG: T9SS type A sorting domain-containing protein [Chlorobi bacterium]|nr:T9SS type A sorting domain-containing protein [Chlorobiota bacterium]
MKDFTKFITSIFLFLFLSFNSDAQEMWGMTEYGGNDNVGVIYKTNDLGNQFSREYMFNDDSHATNPVSGVILYDDNTLRGVTGSGGVNNEGTMYSISLSQNYFIKLKDLGGTEGAYPRGMVLGDNGIYYGVTRKGGTNDYGTIYKVENGVHSVIYNFDAPSGSDYCYPFSTLLYYDGNLYGIYLPRNSYYDYGLFKYNISTGTLTHLAALDPNAGTPKPNIVLSDDNSKLYFNLNMKLYSYDLSSDVLSTVIELTEQFTQFDKLIKTSDGSYYAIIGYSYRLYLLDMQDGTATNKYVKGNNVVEASNGKLYLFNDDGINEYDPADDSYQTVYVFNNPDGNDYSFSGNIVEKDGKLYGTTRYNGKYNKGTIFSFDINTYEYVVTHDFKGATGFHPRGRLARHTDGKLYGLTSSGYYNNNGSLFSFNPVTEVFKVEHYFGYDASNYYDDEDGKVPYGGLISFSLNDKDYLMGTTFVGGTDDYGTVFLHRSREGYKKIVDFNGSNGKFPYGDVVFASDNNIYGTTFSGGTNGKGVIYKIAPGEDLYEITYSVIYNFGSTTNDGDGPISGLMEYSGFLWGVTYNGGDDDLGTVFAYLLSSDMYVKQASFTGDNGSHPVGNLVYYNGKIYGVTKTGGSYDKGTIFEYDLQSSTITVRHNFSDSGDGYEPVGGLTVSNDKLYGVCSKGGSAGTGTFFEFDPATGTINHKTTLDGIWGASPAVNNGIITACIAREITPVDEELPVITAQCEVSSLDTVKAITNCGDTIIGVTDAELPVTGEGTYTVTWTYSDNLGNVATQEQTILIDDTEAPLPDAASLPDLYNDCQINDPLRNSPTATDNCKGTFYGKADVSFPITEEGTTVITWTFDDGNGNVSTQTQNAFVGIDNSVTVNGDTITANASGDYTYQWYQRSGSWTILLQDETDRTFIAQADGVFYVEISNGTCSVTSDDITVSVSGINDKVIKGISVYPNPVKDILTIYNKESVKITVSLFDVAGNKTETISPTNSSVKIDMTKYTKGIYFIVINDGQTSEIRKIIKK